MLTNAEITEVQHLRGFKIGSNEASKCHQSHHMIKQPAKRTTTISRGSVAYAKTRGDNDLRGRAYVMSSGVHSPVGLIDKEALVTYGPYRESFTRDNAFMS